MAGVTAQKSPTEAAIDGLVGALKDSDAGVRRQAAAALGAIGSPRAVPGLIEPLKDATRRAPRAVSRSAKSATRVRCRRSRRAEGRDAARPRARRHRRSAISATARAVDPLIALIRDADVDVRSRAISALGEIGDARALEPSTAALKDADAGVRLRAVKALAELTDIKQAECRARGRTPRPRPVVHLVGASTFRGLIHAPASQASIVVAIGSFALHAHPSLAQERGVRELVAAAARQRSRSRGHAPHATFASSAIAPLDAIDRSSP